MSGDDVREALRDTVTRRSAELEPSRVPWAELRRRRGRGTRRRAAAGAAVLLAASAAAGALAVSDLPGRAPWDPAAGADRLAATATVPDVIGLPAATAETVLEDAGLSPALTTADSEQAPGAVIAQDPAAGERVTGGSRVTVTVARESTATPTEVPVLPDDRYVTRYTDVRLTARTAKGCGQVFFDLDVPVVNGSLGGSELYYGAPPCGSTTGPSLQTGDRPLVAVDEADASASGCARAVRDAPTPQPAETALRPGLVLCGRADGDRMSLYRMVVVSVRGGTTTVEVTAWAAP